MRIGEADYIGVVVTAAPDNLATATAQWRIDGGSWQAATLDTSTTPPQVKAWLDTTTLATDTIHPVDFEVLDGTTRRIFARSVYVEP